MIPLQSTINILREADMTERGYSLLYRVSWKMSLTLLVISLLIGSAFSPGAVLRRGKFRGAISTPKRDKPFVSLAAFTLRNQNKSVYENQFNESAISIFPMDDEMTDYNWTYRSLITKNGDSDTTNNVCSISIEFISFSEWLIRI